MKLKNRVIASLFFALAVFSISLFSSFIPCQTAPSVPNPDYAWTFCTLNPDSILDLNVERVYLGYSPSLLKTYITVFGLSFFISLALLSFAPGTKKE
ncbi:MAG: hypothetical protein Q7S33_05320 [Nanoarchaeota archaeon]|nr:hypothetical protein [Nanoarchaeota archaeon]